MEVGSGKSILNGIAIGKIKVYKKPVLDISEEQIEDTEAELQRFEEARQKAIEDKNKLYEKAMEEVGEETAEIFEVHAMMLDDDDYVDSIKELITEEKRCAEYAVKTGSDNMARLFSEMDDAYMQARAADILDIGTSILDILTGNNADSIQGSEEAILAAEDLAPSETVRLNKDLLLGFITREGSTNSHTAILARSMNIPALVQCKEVADDWDGKEAIIDGYNSKVYIDPDPEILKELKAKQEEDKKERTLLEGLKGKTNTTIDGHTIRVFANIGSPEDIESVIKNDAEGVGLFRSEFVYLNSKDYPDEETQFTAYKKVLEALSPRLIIIRTCDIGADKTVDYMKLDPEENPALGYRAIRISLTRRDFFKTQLRAMLRASAYGNLGIMFPMIISVKEMKECKEILEECRQELKAEGVQISDKIEVGTMIETPAAVLIADELAEECDFFSLGTNDLTQYTCAIDRQNAKLEPFSDTHHPAVLREIQMTIDAGHRHNCWVGICGELGADTSLTETFLRMGVDELSVNPVSVLPLRKIIRETNLKEAPK